MLGIKIKLPRIPKGLRDWLGFLLNPCDPNGLGIPIWLSVPGFFLGMLDPLLLGVKPATEPLGFILVPCIIAPYALAFASIDKTKEGVPLFFLMGGFASAVMMLGGLGVGLAIAAKHGIEVREGAMSGLTYTWAIVIGIGVSFSYANISAMSRDYRLDIFAPILLTLPFSIQGAVAALGKAGSLDLRDKFAKALCGMTKADLDLIVVDGKLGLVALQTCAYLKSIDFELFDELREDLHNYRDIVQSLARSGTYARRTKTDKGRIARDEMLARSEGHQLARGQIIARVRSHRTSRGRTPFLRR